MHGMFGGARAFNQPLSFETAKVENVSESILCLVQLDETPASDSQLQPNLLPDGLHVLLVRRYNWLQSTIGFRYCQGYGCESIFFLVQLDHETPESDSYSYLPYY